MIHDAGKASRAAADLRSAGFAEAVVQVRTGDEVLANHSAYLDRYGLRHRLGELFPGDGSDALQEYLAEARRGDMFVSVLAPRFEPRDRARGIFAGYGAHALHYYGDLTSSLRQWAEPSNWRLPPPVS